MTQAGEGVVVAVEVVVGGEEKENRSEVRLEVVLVGVEKVGGKVVVEKG